MSDDLDKPYFTKNNFAARLKERFDSDPSLLLGYLSAIDQIMPDLKRKIEAAQNFDDLKKELLETVNGHIETRRYINNEWYDNHSKYGLPYMPDAP
jgi:hypothetical protein